MMINEVGGKAVGLTGKDGCLIQATKKLMADQNNPGQWLDIGYVGDISRIEPAVVKALQDDQFIPVISSIGYGEDGTAYNITADVVAGKMAATLGAATLVMMPNRSEARRVGKGGVRQCRSRGST